MTPPKNQAKDCRTCLHFTIEEGQPTCQGSDQHPCYEGSRWEEYPYVSLWKIGPPPPTIESLTEEIEKLKAENEWLKKSFLPDLVSTHPAPLMPAWDRCTPYTSHQCL